MQNMAPAGIALAFSGGVDSAFLLAVLEKIYRKTPFKLKILTAVTVLQNPAESKDAEARLKQSGLSYEIFRFNPLQIEQVRKNCPDRCYWCKKNIFLRFRQSADAAGIKYLLDGTNANDLKTYRPGLKALKELGICSPLAELGIDKASIRTLSKEMSLNTADKPSVPCMATRFAYNTQLTAEKLVQVAEGENLIKKICPGICNLRLRTYESTARIEVDVADFSVLLQAREEVVKELKKIGFTRIVLDLEGFRSGSYDVHLMKG